MGPSKLALMFIISISIEFITTIEADVLNKNEEKLSNHLKTISKLISDLAAQKNGPSFADITVTSVKQVKSLLVKVIDVEDSSSKRHLMLETIKDLQRLEDWLVHKEPVIKQMEDYCDALNEKQLFKNDTYQVTDVYTVLKYLDDLNDPENVDKTKLKRDINGVIEVLTEEARHMPEVEKLIDYLLERRRVLDGVLDMDRYLEVHGFSVRDLHELHNLTQQFAPFIDDLFEHKYAVSKMNAGYSSLGGDKIIVTPEDAKKMSFMMKLDMFSSMEKVQGKSTKWSKLIEELKLLNNM